MVIFRSTDIGGEEEVLGKLAVLALTLTKTMYQV